MSNEKDKELDDLFKKRMEDPADEAGYREADWDSLEMMLDKHQKRRGIVYLLPVLGSVAALLLLFLGWWLFKPQTENNNHSSNKLQAVAAHKQATTGVNGGPLMHPKGHNQKIPLSANYAGNVNPGKKSSNSKSFFTLSAGGVSRNIVAGSNSGSSSRTGNTSSSRAGDDSSSETLLAENPVPVFDDGATGNQKVKSVKLSLKNAASLMGIAETKSKLKPQAFHPQYGLSVLAAPDINGVGNFQQSKVGTNIGLLFSAGVTKKLTISTGALYSVKPYVAGLGDYHVPYQFQEAPTSVTADCRMLDIPLNVAYQLYNKHQNKFSLGTGLSSYIMLHESYKFSYSDNYAGDPTQFTVPNSNKYFFGVLNLNATYEHQVNQKVGISVQPYLKLPLTNIGYSQVRLQTTGVAIGLNWKLN